ncbi:MAG TPA: tape measure protein [Polyangiaceae bacterium]|nr:tape measure protein [Polyangiaceae bacterium]
MADRSDWAVRLIDQVSGPGKKMKAVVGSLEKTLSGMTRGFKSSAANAFATSITGVTDAMMLAGAAAIGVGVGAVGATADMIDFAQGARQGLGAVAKHGASVEKLFSHIRGEAVELGLDVKDSTKQFTGFLRQGADPAMATNLIRMAADMKAFGAEGTQVESVLFNVNKILAQGKAQGDELAPIFEVLNAKNVFENIAKSANKTVDEIIAMKEAGKLTSEMILPALIGETTRASGGKEAGDAAKKAGDRISGILTRLKGEAQNTLIDIGDGVAPAFMATIKEIRGEISGLLGGKSFKEGAIVALETIANVVRESIPFVRQFVASFADGFSEAWPAIKGALGSLADGFGGGATWMDTVREFASLLGKISAFGAGVAAVFGGEVGASIRFVSHSIEGLNFMWNGMINGIGAAAFAIDDFFSNVAAKWRAFSFADLATSMIDGLVNGITGGVGRVIDAVVNLGQSAKDAFANILDSHSPSKVFEQFGLWSGEGYAIGLENSFDTIGPKFDSVTGSGGVPDFSGGGGGMRQTNHFEINVHVGANDNARELGKQIGESLEEALGSTFERWTLEAAG